ncbi:DUF6360 family protein [Haloplanus sp. GCM10025708]|uniref:DUF6360 family protein n=1 Tax=Haloferacaceae TaxID=1644056 RepID=UPI003617F27C
MADRVLKVNAFTTFDLLDATVRSHDGDESTFAVLDVGADDDGVEVALEVDHTDVDVPAHADVLSLAPDEARELADELRSKADRLDGE